MIFNHPIEFTDGVRVLMLVNRNKDNVEEKRKTILRVSHNAVEFQENFIGLHQICRKHERIYASASPRNMGKSIRAFKFAQLEADYSQNVSDFYEHLNSRWVHALSLETSVDKTKKYWMFDCDTYEEYFSCIDQLAKLNAGIKYSYKTVNGGYHVLTSPFNRSLLDDNVSKLLHTNPMMLWYFREN